MKDVSTSKHVHAAVLSRYGVISRKNIFSLSPLFWHFVTSLQ
ncbi:unnamed protein product [Amoebophrya sp. A25]|nr:unnamed protein product [Amoebophrya sp. A25]|eukprot:GSA25T00001651001.1